jgi:hypothetical protein
MPSVPPVITAQTLSPGRHLTPKPKEWPKKLVQIPLNILVDNFMTKYDKTTIPVTSKYEYLAIFSMNNI